MSGLPPIGQMLDDFEDNDRRREERRRDRPEPVSDPVLHFFANDAAMLPESQRPKATLTDEDLERFQSREGQTVRTTFDEDGNATGTEDVSDELKTNVRDLLEAVRSLPDEIVAALRSS